MANEKVRFVIDGESRLEHSDGTLAKVVSDIVDVDVWSWSSVLTASEGRRVIECRDASGDASRILMVTDFSFSSTVKTRIPY